MTHLSSIFSQLFTNSNFLFFFNKTSIYYNKYYSMTCPSADCLCRACYRTEPRKEKHGETYKGQTGPRCLAEPHIKKSMVKLKGIDWAVAPTCFAQAAWQTISE